MLIYHIYGADLIQSNLMGANLALIDLTETNLKNSMVMNNKFSEATVVT